MPTPFVLAMAMAIRMGSGFAADDIPSDLVVDVRLVEARSMTPDFQAMQELRFFVDTDGRGVSERQWLATIARKAPNAFLATLVYETVPVSAARAMLELERRSRTFRISVDLANFAGEGTFGARVNAELLRGGDVQRAFDQDIDLRLGQTFVWSSSELELSSSDYLSYFRDYSDREHRGEVYDELRDFTNFLIVALTLRRDSTPKRDVVTLTLPGDVELPELESPLDVELVGTIELELDIDEDGVPTMIRIVRSSLPEVNPRLVGEALEWRFPEAAGKTGRLVLELEAVP